ncbi:MAG: type II toxin-antitoxin system VapC family toxin [Jatrophihabitantaceae bacterium]
MILADTSAWVEFLRRSDSATAHAMRRRLGADEVATTDIVIMEVLAGTTDPARLAKARRALDACTYLPQRPHSDATAATALYRQCRLGGETPRQLTDCVIAAVAMRHRVSVLQRDRDYDVISRHTALSVTNA